MRMSRVSLKSSFAVALPAMSAHPLESHSLSSNGLRHLALVIAILGLELLHQRNVLLLGLLGRDALVDLLLPSVLLRLAL